MNSVRSSWGIGTRLGGRAVGPSAVPRLKKFGRGAAAGPGAGGVGPHRAHVVDRLVRGRGTTGRAAPRSAGRRRRARSCRSSIVGQVGGRAAVDLVERALAEDRDEGDVGRRAQALVELEVGVAAARHREALVEAADLLEQLARHEEAVALPHAVEPVAVADEVADVEQPVAVGRPARSSRTARPRTPGRSRRPWRRPAGRGRRTTAGWRRRPGS